MATTIDADVAAALETAAVGTVGDDIFTGPMRDLAGVVPDDAVFVLSTGGPPPRQYQGEAKRELVTSAVQVMVRGATETFGATQTTARAVRAALHLTPPTGYVECAVREAEPVYLGPDAAGRHLFSLNVDLVHVRS